MNLCICTPFHEYILNGFRDVKHKSEFSIFFLNDTDDTVFKLKTSKGIILFKFRCSYDFCSLTFSDHA